MGVFFDESLKGYVHEESVEDHGKFRIELGTVQVPVFERVFDALFEESVSLPVHGSERWRLGGHRAGLRRVAVRHSPRRPRSQFFERLDQVSDRCLRSGGANSLRNGRLPAYGKSNEKNFGFMEDSKGVRVDRSLGARPSRRRRAPVVLLSACARDRAIGWGGIMSMSTFALRRICPQAALTRFSRPA